MKREIGLIFLLIFLISFVSSATVQCDSCSSCNAAISSASANDIIQLNTSISNSPSSCISIATKSNLIFDCLGNTLDGDDDGLDFGIYLQSGTNHTQVRNCLLTDFNYGIYLHSGFNDTLSNITATSNVNRGIGVENSRNNTISNIVVNFNYHGIMLETASNNTLSNITVNSNTGHGIQIFVSSNNILRNNNFSNNSRNFDVQTNFLNDIDPSNIIEEHRIYYNFSASNYEFNETTAPDAGIVYCVNCMNVTYKGLNLSRGYYGLYFLNTSNSRIENLAVNSNFQAGISLSSSSNNTLLNVTSTSSIYGIIFSSSSNNTLLNVTSNSNIVDGIYFYLSPNNTLSGIIATLNNQSGIYLGTDSDNTSLSNSIINANNFGVYLYNSDRNYFDNLTIIDNSYDGVNATSGSALLFFDSSNNTLNNSQIRRNYNFAFYLNHSRNNTIKGNIIENHSTGAIKFNSGSTGNLIYNNFLNSTLNYNQSGSVGNFFNTTKTLGTNIVGGDYIGGNFWGFMNGTGFSEQASTCTDSDGDDICDGYYNLSDGSYDYLPLRLISFTLPDLPESVYSPKKSNSGGGFLTPAIQTNQETQSIPKISAGSSASVSVKNSKIDIRNIKMSVNSNIINASLTVEGIEVENFTIPFPSGNLYKAFSITTKAISNEQLDNVTIDFRVNKTKLAEFNASYENVLLYRVPSNESLWQQLPTVSITDDDIYYYFSSISPGFSSFIIFIAEENIQCEVSQTRCFNDEVQVCSDDKIWATSEICDYGCSNGKCINFFSANVLIITYSAAGFILIIITAYYVVKKNKQKSFSKPEKKIPAKKNKISYNKNNKLDKFIR